MKFKQGWDNWAFPVIGVGYGVMALADYYFLGFSWHMFGLWLGSIGIFGWHFFAVRQVGWAKPNVTRLDFAVILGLILAFVPLYLWRLHQLPVQVNTDEIILMGYFQRLAHAAWVDPFSIMGDYFGLPSGIFVVFGKLIGLLGGITLYHTRIIHALSGLAIIAAGFCLFRQLLSRWWAIVATIVMGVNHSLVMISRMAMRDNTGLLVELLALNFLVFGLRRRSLFWTFVGGAVAGLSVYTYYPVRILLPLWLLMLSIDWLARKSQRSIREIAAMAGVTILGWFLVAAPGLVSSIGSFSLTMPFQREQFLFTHEGRQAQMQWVGANTETEGIRRNIIQGLGVFNAQTVDHGWIYPNYGHGFVDPITGCLVWVGLIASLVCIVRRRGSPGDTIGVVGLLALLFSFSFVITKAPDYTRLLIILPFVAYLVARGLMALYGLLPKRWASAGSVGVTLAVGIIVVANLLIARDFVVAGQRNGNNVGSTLRYVEGLPHKPDYTLLLAADNTHPYYSWGNESAWLSWLSFGNQEARARVVMPSRLLDTLPPSHFSIFMNQLVWLQNGRILYSIYPQGKLTQLTSAPILYVFTVK